MDYHFFPAAPRISHTLWDVRTPLWRPLPQTEHSVPLFLKAPWRALTRPHPSRGSANSRGADERKTAWMGHRGRPGPLPSTRFAEPLGGRSDRTSSWTAPARPYSAQTHLTRSQPPVPASQGRPWGWGFPWGPAPAGRQKQGTDKGGCCFTSFMVAFLKSHFLSHSERQVFLFLNVCRCYSGRVSR